MKTQTTSLSILLIIFFSCKKDITGNQKSRGYQIFNVQNSDLPTNFVNHIAIDNASNIWVGTFDKGVAKYNGQKWTVYNTQNSPLPNDSIQSLSADVSGKLWIGTSNGLASLDQQTWKIYNASNSALKAKIILSICSDSSGIVWVSGISDTVHSGLYSFDGSVWKFYNQKNSILPNDIITTLAVTMDNTLLIGNAIWQGKGGLTKLKNGNWQHFDMDNSQIKYNVVDNISISRQGRILLSSSALVYDRPNILEGYLQEFDGTDTWIDFSPSNPSLHLSNRVTASVYDNDNSIWFATSPDMQCSTCVYTLVKNDRQNLKIYSSEAGNFPNTFIPDIKVDKENNIWIAASDAGLIKLKGE